MTRRLAVVTAALFASLAVAAGSASAKTVHDYVYSGTFFDGSGAGQTFNGSILGIDYDRSSQEFFVLNGGASASLTKITPAGAGVNFPSSGTPRVSYPFGGSNTTQVSLDQTGGTLDGNIYVSAGTQQTGFNPDGSVLPGASFYTGECGIAADPLNDRIVTSSFNGLRFYSVDGDLLATVPAGPPGLQAGTKSFGYYSACRPVFDSENFLYGLHTEGGESGRLKKFAYDGTELYEVSSNTSRAIAIDYSNDDVFALRSNNTFEMYDKEGRKLGSGWGVTAGPYAGLAGGPRGIAVDPVTHDVWIANRREYPGGVRRVEKFERTNPHIIPDSTAIEPDYNHPTGDTVRLQGIVNPDGVPTTDCHFEYGPTQQLGTSIDCSEGHVFNGSTDQAVTTNPLVFGKGARYYYRLSTKNANNQIALSNMQAFIPQGNPILNLSFVDRIKTDGARFSAEFDPNGGNGSFYVEFGEAGGPLNQTTPDSTVFGFQTVQGENLYKPGVYSDSITISGLKPGATYEYRVVATNEAGDTPSPIGEFKTYAPDPGIDTCGNALTRQQTGSSLLLDCRGYELVTPSSTGGFDVLSDIVPSQSPLDAYPRATDSVLFSVHVGVVPGISGSPPNLGPDPYIARRGPNGWETEYVGVPADGMADEGAFGSPLLGADPALRNFAFGGKDICDPCFPDGSTNVPLRLANGELIKGMAGSLNPAADPAETVRQPFSADGSHFVFGSDAKFETAGDAGGSIYKRNLAGGTQVVSTMPTGLAMTGGDVGQLAISEDGSRVVVGERISTDSKGNEFWHLYMHLGSGPNSVDLTPGTTTGVLYDGMSADGSRVFFTTWDKLSGDTDTSADIYETSVSGAGTPATRLISTKGGIASNTDTCSPPNDPDTWNAVSGDGKCSAVAFAGAAGIGGDGTFYFASPELLDGPEGEQDQANLYVVKPGNDPVFVATISSSVGNEAVPPPEHPVVDSTFVSGLKSPETIAVDQSNGDLYVSESGGGGGIARYTSAGAPKNFTEGPGAGTNKIPGVSICCGESQIAFDSAPSSPLKGTIYVTSFSGSVSAYSSTGLPIGAVTGFFYACGVSVDQSNGDLYIGDYSMQGIRRLHPESGGPVSNANYGPETSITTEGVNPCNVEADSVGHAYAKAYGSNTVKQYAKSEFGPGAPLVTGKVISASSTAIQSDAENGDMYVDEGNQIAVYDDETGALIQKFGAGEISSSKGVAINAASKRVYATSGGNIVEFGHVVPPFRPVESPAVLHGSGQSGVHSFADFQATPDGRYAAFASKRSLTGYINRGRSEVYRYDSEEGELLCASCSPTLGAPIFDTTLPSHGQALTDDGRVFFTTQEALALRDTNERLDAYEWSPADGTQLISTGIAPQDSGLATVSSDGVNAFFFTREVLTHDDENGNSVKIYVAREDGGVVNDPERKQCAASDECHGPGTVVPPPPGINTISRTTVPTRKAACKRNQVKRRGRCVKKPKKRQSKRRKAARSHG